jgi:hypothetical protein
MNDRKSFVSALADFLTWGLALVSVGAAWWQTARLFGLFGDPTAPWWAYIAASSIEGAIVVCGLLLMEERETMVSVGAFLVFVVNVIVSVMAQIGEAAFTAGYAAPTWMSLVVRLVAPAMVTLVGASLWGLKIARSRAQVSDEGWGMKDESPRTEGAGKTGAPVEPGLAPKPGHVATGNGSGKVRAAKTPPGE